MAGNPITQKIRMQLAELKGAQVIVGVQEEPGTNRHGHTVSSDTEMMKIAYVHEYGYDIEVTHKMRAWLHHNGIHLKAETTHIHIPERSYIRRAQADGKASMKAVLDGQIGRLFHGDVTVDQIFEVIGKQMLEDVAGSMGNGVKPVTQYTLEHRKESSNPTPLSDTGALLNHVTYRTVKSGGAAAGNITSSWSGSG